MLMYPTTIKSSDFLGQSYAQSDNVEKWDDKR